MKEGSAQVPGPRSRRDRWILPGGKTGQTLNVRAKLLTRLEITSGGRTDNYCPAEP